MESGPGFVNLCVPPNPDFNQLLGFPSMFLCGRILPVWLLQLQLGEVHSLPPPLSSVSSCPGTEVALSIFSFSNHVVSLFHYHRIQTPKPLNTKIDSNGVFVGFFSANTYVAAEILMLHGRQQWHTRGKGWGKLHHERWQLKGTWNFLDICRIATAFLFSCIRKFLQAHQHESFKGKVILWKENEQCCKRLFCSRLQSTTALHAVSIFGILKKSKIPLKAFFFWQDFH